VPDRKLEADVSALQVEVHDLRQAVERNTESLSEVREGFQRLRGELNGVLPRLEEKVERVIEHLNGREEYFEKVRVHETEIGTLFEQVGKKADAEANREEHGRLWLALRLFFYGTLVALAGLLLAKVLG
jgi:chromosome segregation ATPase